MGFGLFMIFFGLVWGGTPTVVVFSMVISGEAPAMVLFPVLIFTIIGSGMVMVGIKKVITAIKLKRLETTGKESIGTYVSHQTNTRVNGVPYFFIVFTYENDKGQIVEAKTDSKYRYDQADYYAHIKKFKVRYDNQYCVITEPVNYRILQELQNQAYRNEYMGYNRFPNQNTYPTQQVEMPKKEVYYVCDYCGCTLTKPGKCKYCGANVSKIKK